MRPFSDDNPQWLTIVGVVSNTLTYSLREAAPVPQFYVSLLDSARANLPSAHDVSYVLHVTGNAMSYLPTVRNVIRE